MKTIKKTMNKNNGLSARYGYEDNNIKVELKKIKLGPKWFVWEIEYESEIEMVIDTILINTFKGAKKRALELINK